jgi:hypothetical protein
VTSKALLEIMESLNEVFKNVPLIDFPVDFNMSTTWIKPTGFKAGQLPEWAAYPPPSTNRVFPDALLANIVYVDDREGVLEDPRQTLNKWLKERSVHNHVRREDEWS